MVSSKPRLQRKRAFTAPLHRRRILVGAHLDPKLLEKSKERFPRALPVRKGDTVRIMRGNFRGREGTVVSVDRIAGTVVVEGVTIEKTDEKKKPRPIHASNLMITKLDDTDPWRRRKFQE
ncbi:MAG: 50S ribosomal protein L24 [Euryarchaeota archaeon RBG_16_68_13]|nr:50S ribosomal protein L24, large subunit ribosomal protein L24 [uncultured archaeon]OGS48122.1 MAG: 50S ribosomal protein L24 [Euryarchaeota archaeon RBG_16_68_13]